MSHRALRISRLFVFALAVVFASPSFAYKHDFNQTYPLEPGGSFRSPTIIGW